MSPGAHLSIGEVLSLLQEEFPDVTISKIRFLESQGLIQPERTAAGYRKFYEADIERLRWVLRQQRDHFLPLKVIRKMLEEGVDRYDPARGEQPTLFTPVSEPEPEDDDGELVHAGAPPTAPGTPRSPAHPAVASAPPARQHRAAARPAAPPATPAPSPASGAATPEPRAAAARPPAGGRDRTPTGGDEPAGGTTRDAATAPPTVGSSDAGRGGTGASGTGATGDPEGPAADGPGDDRATARPVDGPREEAGRGGGRRGRLETPADVVAALQEDPRRRPKGGRRTRPEGSQEEPTAPEASAAPASASVHAGALAEEDRRDLTADELCAAAGIDRDALAGLERFGLVVSTDRAGEAHYDGDALGVARVAARYLRLGVEPRHLRMYLVSAEREAGFVEQLVTPLLKQRNPEARGQAGELADDLAALGAELHARLLRRELRPGLGR